MGDLKDIKDGQMNEGVRRTARALGAVLALITLFWHSPLELDNVIFAIIVFFAVQIAAKTLTWVVQGFKKD
jgi:hypothetical protein